MKYNEMGISYPAALGPEFRAFCVQHGYIYQSRASAKAFFCDLTSGYWIRRDPTVPIPPYQEFPGGQTGMTVAMTSFRVLTKRGRHYKTFGHLIQDIIAGNWARNPNGKEGA